jgi:hypothetical protein
VMVVETVPPVLLAVMLYIVGGQLTTSGRPLIAQVAPFNVSPSGRGGYAVQSVIAA